MSVEAYGRSFGTDSRGNNRQGLNDETCRLLNPTDLQNREDQPQKKDNAGRDEAVEPWFGPFEVGESHYQLEQKVVKRAAKHLNPMCGHNVLISFRHPKTCEKYWVREVIDGFEIAKRMNALTGYVCVHRLLSRLRDGEAKEVIDLKVQSIEQARRAHDMIVEYVDDYDAYSDEPTHSVMKRELARSPLGEKRIYPDFNNALGFVSFMEEKLLPKYHSSNTFGDDWEIYLLLMCTVSIAYRRFFAIIPTLLEFYQKEKTTH